MAEFIRSNIVDAHTMATEVLVEPLPITPLSHLILTIEYYQETDQATVAKTWQPSISTCTDPVACSTTWPQPPPYGPPTG